MRAVWGVIFISKQNIGEKKIEYRLILELKYIIFSCLYVGSTLISANVTSDLLYYLFQFRCHLSGLNNMIINIIWLHFLGFGLQTLIYRPG